MIKKKKVKIISMLDKNITQEMVVFNARRGGLNKGWGSSRDDVIPVICMKQEFLKIL